MQITEHSDKSALQFIDAHLDLTLGETGKKQMTAGETDSSEKNLQNVLKDRQ